MSSINTDTLLDLATAAFPRAAANVMLIEGNTARVVKARNYERWGEASARFIQAYSTDINCSEIRRCVYELKQPAVVPDVRNWPSWIDTPPEMNWLQSYAVIPICNGGQVVGFLNLVSDKTRAFGKADVERLLASITAAGELSNVHIREISY